MLTLEGCLSRRRRLWDLVPASIEWLLIADPRHVQYLANFWVQPLSFSGGERCLLLLKRDGEATLLGDNFAIRSGVHTPYIDRDITIRWYDHQHSVFNRDHALVKALAEVADELKDSQGLVEAEWLPLGMAAQLDPQCYSFAIDQETDSKNLIDLGTILRHLRRSKEQDEIDLLKQCMKAGEVGQARALEFIEAGVTEIAVYREVQKAAIEAAGRPAVVYGDFRACFAEEPKNGGLPKGEGRTLQKGDLYVLDYSVTLDGYRSDFTNTISVGEPSSEVRELLAICEAGLSAGEKELAAGRAAVEVYEAVAKPYHEAGKKEFFTHHAGHGIGLAHPEAPILVPASGDTLVAGDVVTLEPGIYVPGVGGMRIERNYLITETGAESLSHHQITLGR